MVCKPGGSSDKVAYSVTPPAPLQWLIWDTLPSPIRNMPERLTQDIPSHLLESAASTSWVNPKQFIHLFIQLREG